MSGAVSRHKKAHHADEDMDVPALNLEPTVAPHVTDVADAPAGASRLTTLCHAKSEWQRLKALSERIARIADSTEAWVMNYAATTIQARARTRAAGVTLVVARRAARAEMQLQRIAVGLRAAAAVAAHRREAAALAAEKGLQRIAVAKRVVAGEMALRRAFLAYRAREDAAAAASAPLRGLAARLRAARRTAFIRRRAAHFAALMAADDQMALLMAALRIVFARAARGAAAAIRRLSGADADVGIGVDVLSTLIMAPSSLEVPAGPAALATRWQMQVRVDQRRLRPMPAPSPVSPDDIDAGSEPVLPIGHFAAAAAATPNAGGGNGNASGGGGDGEAGGDAGGRIRWSLLSQHSAGLPASPTLLPDTPMEVTLDDLFGALHDVCNVHDLLAADHVEEAKDALDGIFASRLSFEAPSASTGVEVPGPVATASSTEVDAATGGPDGSSSAASVGAAPADNEPNAAHVPASGGGPSDAERSQSPTRASSRRNSGDGAVADAGVLFIRGPPAVGITPAPVGGRAVTTPPTDEAVAAAAAAAAAAGLPARGDAPLSGAAIAAPASLVAARDRKNN